MQGRIFAQNRDAVLRISLKILTGDIWTNQMAIVNHVVKNVKATRNAEPLNADPRTAVGGQGELVTK